MTFMEDVVNLLVGAGLGVVNTTIFRSSNANIPVGDGPLISITDTGGSGATRVQDKKVSTERPSLQIVTRAAKFEVAAPRARAIYNLLNGMWNVTLGGTFYQSITARQPPTDIGKDDAGRVMLSFNIDAERQP